MSREELMNEFKFESTGVKQERAIIISKILEINKKI